MSSPKPRPRLLVLCVVVAIISFLLLQEFASEVLALGWHVRNGRTVQLKSGAGKSLSIDAPAVWFPNLDEGGWSIGLHRRTGRLRASLSGAKWGLVSVSVAPTPSTASRTKESAAILETKLGITVAEAGKVHVAGHSLTCFERKWNHPNSAAIAADVVELECVPERVEESLSASFFGTRNLLPEFYSLLSRVHQAH